MSFSLCFTGLIESGFLPLGLGLPPGVPLWARTLGSRCQCPSLARRPVLVWTPWLAPRVLRLA